jgi:uncharacterized protein
VKSHSWIQRLLIMSRVLLFVWSAVGSASAVSAPLDDAKAAMTRGDFERALNILRPLADHGDADAQELLARMYVDGKGVPQSREIGFDWLKKAASQGRAADQYMIGVMYRTGTGIAKDEAMAASWFLKAANQGDADAQDNLGALYRYGAGVPKDFDQEFTWTEKAAKQNDARAQLNLSRLYYLGEGAPRDLVQAYSWLSMSILNASARDPEVGPTAIHIRDGLTPELSHEQLNQAQKLISEWSSTRK